MSLPAGRLWSYDLEAGEDGASLPVSFDQARHVGAGDRPGSWMALALRHTTIDRGRLGLAWERLVSRHGTLRTAFHPRTGGAVSLREIPLGAGEWVEHEVDAGDVRRSLRSLLDARCRPFGRPSHLLTVVEHPDSITLVLASDHAHVDMWSLAVLVRDLLVLIDDPDAPLETVRSFAAHTTALEQMPPAPQDVRDEWARILRDGGDVMPRFPLPLGDVSAPGDAVVVVRDVLDADGLATLHARARAVGVSPLALALSAMTQASLDLAGAPLRAVFPVHSRFEDAWRETVGWMITNSVLESDDPDPRACQAAVKRSLRLGSWPLAELLAPWGGMPEAPGMFAASWLDSSRLPVDPADAERAQYVSASIRTDGVMIWFITNPSGLHLRCRYPDTPEARASVGTWLDTVVASIDQPL